MNGAQDNIHRQGTSARLGAREPSSSWIVVREGHEYEGEPTWMHQAQLLAERSEEAQSEPAQLPEARSSEKSELIDFARIVSGYSAPPPTLEPYYETSAPVRPPRVAFGTMMVIAVVSFTLGATSALVLSGWPPAPRERAAGATKPGPADAVPHEPAHGTQTLGQAAGRAAIEPEPATTTTAGTPGAGHATSSAVAEDAPLAAEDAPPAAEDVNDDAAGTHVAMTPAQRLRMRLRAFARRTATAVEPVPGAPRSVAADSPPNAQDPAVAPAASSEAPATPEGEAPPARPNRAAVRMAIQSVAPAIRACAPTHQGRMAILRVKFAATGRTLESGIVRAEGVPAAQRSCMARAARAAVVPPFRGEPLVVTYPVAL